MITQALSYRPVDRATPPGPRTGKGGLRPVDSVHLIDAARAKMVTASEAREPDGCRDYSNLLELWTRSASCCQSRVSHHLRAAALVEGATNRRVEPNLLDCSP